MNIFRAIHKNPSFMGVAVITIVLQVIIVQFGGVVFKVPTGGISGMAWVSTVLLGSGTLLVGAVVRLLPDVKISTTAEKYRSEVQEQAEAPLLIRVDTGSIVSSEAPPRQAIQDSQPSEPPLKRAQTNWKKAIDKTQLQIRVIKAFREPGAGNKGRTSVSGSGSSMMDTSDRMSKSGHAFSMVNAVRGGRTTASDYIALQILDPNEARSKAMNK